jgi:nucleotide-binding universal stress UspA family protein
MKTILVPVDFSNVTASVVANATAMAAAMKMRLVLLHVAEPEPDFVGFEPGPLSVREAVAHDFQAEHHKLEELKAGLAASGLDVTALQVQGMAVEKIVSEAGKLGADYIVMGSHGHGALYHLIVGSATEGVLKKSPCPVVVVPGRAA